MNSLHYVGLLGVPKNFWVFRILATAIHLLNYSVVARIRGSTNYVVHHIYIFDARDLNCTASVRVESVIGTAHVHSIHASRNTCRS